MSTKPDDTLDRPLLARGTRYRWDTVRREHQLVWSESLMVINETGAAIVQLCDGRTFDQLIDALQDRFPDRHTRRQMREHVRWFLLELAERGLLRSGATAHLASSASGMSDATFSAQPSAAIVPSRTRPTPAPPRALLAELTYRCPLRCPYCSNPLQLDRYRRELDTSDWQRVLAEAAALGVVHVHFSGGEPLLRRDLIDLVRHARRHDLYTNLSTSAATADERILTELKSAGLDALQISLLDARPSQNDWLAGVPSFDKKQRTLEAARRLDLPITLNVVLHRHNLDHLASVIELAREWNVDRLELAHVQYVGWAFRNRAALLPTREQVRRAVALVDAARQRPDTPQILHVLPDYFQQYPKACLHGWASTFLTVAPDGAVLPCQAAREIDTLDFPNVCDTSLHDVWYDAPVFNRFRGTDWLPEPCHSCDRREIDFGGCRCQAYLLTGDVQATDPVCHLAPHHDLVEATLRDAATATNEFHYRTMRRSAEAV